MARPITTSNKPVIKVNPDRLPAKNGGRLTKLTDDQIDSMVMSYNAGTTQKALGEMYGVSVSTVRRYLKSRE